MGLEILLLVVGMGALYIGAEWLVRGGVQLGASIGLSRVVIGLTIVSLGTSAPELIVCTVAALRGSGDLAVGNVIGSNLANIGLILGITALLTPLFIAERVILKEIPVMLAVSILAYPLLFDGRVSRTDGIILLCVLAAYLVYLFWIAKRGDEEAIPHVPVDERTLAGADAGNPDNPRRRALRSLSLIVIGAVGLLIGGELIVGAASGIAEAMDLSELFIGLTIVAIGTSLPELATSVVAALKQEADVAVGNIIGSNVFNLTAVLGIASIVAPFNVPVSVLRGEYLAMLALSLIILPIAWMNYRIYRPGGILLIVLYVGVLWYFM